VGANYRATQRSRSKAEFISKLAIVIEEADEVLFWLDLLVRAEIVTADRLKPLMKETNELVSIFVASQKTLRKAPFIQHS
jgi:four helix bundle protein